MHDVNYAHCVTHLDTKWTEAEKNGCHFADDIFKFIFIDTYMRH